MAHTWPRRVSCAAEVRGDCVVNPVNVLLLQTGCITVASRKYGGRRWRVSYLTITGGGKSWNMWQEKKKKIRFEQSKLETNSVYSFLPSVFHLLFYFALFELLSTRNVCLILYIRMCGSASCFRTFSAIQVMHNNPIRKLKLYIDQ